MRKLAAFTGGFSLGIFLAQYLLPDIWMLPAAGVFLLLACGTLLLPFEWRRRGVVIFCATAIALGYNWLYCRQVQHPSERLAGETDRVVFTLCDYASATDYGAKVEVSMDNLSSKVVYYGGEELLEMRPGQQIEDEVLFQDAARIRDNDISTFTSKGIFLLAYSRGTPVVKEGVAKEIRWLPAKVCRRVQEKIQELFEGDSSAFLCALLTGDRSFISNQANNDLSEAGLAHIMAVSGMHCGFMLSILMLLIGKHRHRLIAAIAIPVLVFYALLTGASPSVIRACIMLTFMMLASLFHRDSDGITSLLLALFLILACNPFAASSISLQLSFAATAGILWLTPKLFTLLTAGKNAGKIRTFMAASVAATAGALVFSTPVSAYYFGTLSLISPISNLLCLWAVSAVFALGLLAVLFGFCLMPLAVAVSGLTGILIQYILHVAHALATIPYHAIYCVNPYLKFWLLFTYILFFTVYFGKGKYRIFIVSAAATLVLTVYLGTSRYDGDLEIVVADAGQGQSIVLASQGAFALVDCGSANNWYDTGNNAADLLKTMGCRELDALILTHFDSDHANGMTDLFTRLEIENLYIPEIPDQDGIQHHLVEIATQYHTNICYVKNEGMISLGLSELRMLPAKSASADDNEQGIAVLATLGEQDLLITGDMNRASEKHMMEVYDLPDIETLVAGHHGAKGATSVELLNSLKPETVCISVGSNSYGHPAEETLRRLAEQDCTVYRTDAHGDIRLSWNEGEQHGKEVE